MNTFSNVVAFYVVIKNGCKRQRSNWKWESLFITAVHSAVINVYIVNKCFASQWLLRNCLLLIRNNFNVSGKTHFAKIYITLGRRDLLVSGSAHIYFLYSNGCSSSSDVTSVCRKKPLRHQFINQIFCGSRLMFRSHQLGLGTRRPPLHRAWGSFQNRIASRLHNVPPQFGWKWFLKTSPLGYEKLHQP